MLPIQQVLIDNMKLTCVEPNSRRFPVFAHTEFECEFRQIIQTSPSQLDLQQPIFVAKNGNIAPSIANLGKNSSLTDTVTNVRVRVRMFMCADILGIPIQFQATMLTRMKVNLRETKFANTHKLSPIMQASLIF